MQLRNRCGSETDAAQKQMRLRNRCSSETGAAQKQSRIGDSRGSATDAHRYRQWDNSFNGFLHRGTGNTRHRQVTVQERDASEAESRGVGINESKGIFKEKKGAKRWM
jgi:hypothetical protein